MHILIDIIVIICHNNYREMIPMNEFVYSVN